jgi:hypothetical protein
VARSNNGLKLTARSASVEARQLNPVLGGLAERCEESRSEHGRQRSQNVWVW